MSSAEQSVNQPTNLLFGLFDRVLIYRLLCRRHKVRLRRRLNVEGKERSPYQVEFNVYVSRNTDNELAAFCSRFRAPCGQCCRLRKLCESGEMSGRRRNGPPTSIESPHDSLFGYSFVVIVLMSRIVTVMLRTALKSEREYCMSWS